MRIALLTTSWPRDAADHAGRFLVPQVRELQRAGVEVEIVAPGRGFRDFGLAGGAGVVANAKRRPWLLPLMLVSMVLGLRRAARRADIVHAHWLLVAPIAALGGRPVVLTLHGSGTAGRFADLSLAERMPALFAWLVRRAAIVIGVSQPLVDAAAHAGATAVLIPHGVTVPPPRTEPDGTPIVLFAGRLSPEKGIGVLMEATEGLEGITLVVVGDGPQRALAPQALGFRTHEQLQAHYAEASILVMPSLSEGFGVVALEAMAHGLPVIASRVGGLTGLVEDDVTGLLVEPGDAHQLREAVERLRADPALRRRLGATGRAAAVERFGWDAVTELTIGTYRRAAASQQPHPAPDAPRT